MQNNTIKRIRKTVSFTPEGIESIRLLQLSSHGASAADVINAAVCERAGRIGKEARERLDAIVGRQDGYATVMIMQLERQIAENERRAAEREKALQDQIETLAGFCGTLMARLDLRDRNGGQ